VVVALDIGVGELLSVLQLYGIDMDVDFPWLGE
jgi:hypothetical protein